MIGFGKLQAGPSGPPDRQPEEFTRSTNVPLTDRWFDACRSSCRCVNVSAACRPAATWRSDRSRAATSAMRAARGSRAARVRRHCDRRRSFALDQAAMRAIGRQMARLIEEPDALPLFEDEPQVFRREDQLLGPHASDRRNRSATRSPLLAPSQRPKIAASNSLRITRLLRELQLLSRRVRESYSTHPCRVCSSRPRR